MEKTKSKILISLLVILCAVLSAAVSLSVFSYAHADAEAKKKYETLTYVINETKESLTYSDNVCYSVSNSEGQTRINFTVSNVTQNIKEFEFFMGGPPIPIIDYSIGELNESGRILIVTVAANSSQFVAFEIESPLTEYGNFFFITGEEGDCSSLISNVYWGETDPADLNSNTEDPGEDPDEPGQGTETPGTNNGSNTQHNSYTPSDSMSSDVFIKVLSVLGLFIFVGILFYIPSLKSEKKKTKK